MEQPADADDATGAAAVRDGHEREAAREARRRLLGLYPPRERRRDRRREQQRDEAPPVRAPLAVVGVVPAVGVARQPPRALHVGKTGTTHSFAAPRQRHAEEQDRHGVRDHEMLGTEPRGPQRVERPLRKDRPEPLLRAKKANPVVGDEEQRFYYELHDEQVLRASPWCYRCAKNAPCVLAPAMLGSHGWVASLRNVSHKN